MIPLRLVIDTNVVVSSALKPEGLKRTVVLLAMAKPVRWYVSDAILSVLARPELKIRKSLRQQLLQLIKNHTRVVTPSRLPQVTTDPADNMFIECADAARAGPGHGQLAPFSAVLEKYYAHHFLGIS
jgi:uncharacterized protein